MSVWEDPELTFGEGAAVVQAKAKSINVLSIGNREVAMHAVLQMDEVPHTEIVPIGRINLLPRGGDKMVIGETWGGALVVATYYYASDHLPCDDQACPDDCWGRTADALPLIILG